MQNFESFLKAGLSASAFQRLNFYPNSQSNMLSQLRATKPSGKTSLYDAVLVGMKRLLELHRLLTALQTSSIWNFVHIIVTDGEDTSSQQKLKDLLALMGIIGMTLQKTVLKTWFIGVDVESNKQALNDLMALSAIGGENSDFMSISNLEIGKVFEKLKIQLGMGKKIDMVQAGNVMAIQQRNVIQINMKQERYVVLFTLDTSGSMEGKKWSKLIEGVGSFLKGLSAEDLVACTTFNEKVLIHDNEMPAEDEEEDDEGNEGLILLKALMALSLQNK